MSMERPLSPLLRQRAVSPRDVNAARSPSTTEECAPPDSFLQSRQWHAFMVNGAAL
jgi:hypothetical protein